MWDQLPTRCPENPFLGSNFSYPLSCNSYISSPLIIGMPEGSGGQILTVVLGTDPSVSYLYSTDFAQNTSLHLIAF
jgi:hypothetical protein